MTTVERDNAVSNADMPDIQRFVFHDADWAFYEHVSRQLDEQRVFATYYKGRLEVVTLSRRHEGLVSLISQIIWVLAEETDTPLGPSGMTTLKRQDLGEALEPDSSFYIAHEQQMRGKKEIDLSIDPPPDLAIEVEITRRLGERKTIYRDLGVPEIWVWHDSGLAFLLRHGEKYEPSEKSPTFPLLPAHELSSFVTAGLQQNGITWIKSFRQRVREAAAAR